MTARVLLLTKTSTYRAEAYLDAARRLGFAVVTGTDEPNYLAAMDPDHNITVPFDQIEKAVAAARSVHEREPLSGVVSTDAGGVVAAAAIGSALRLTHNDPAAARATLSKASMRRLFAASPKLLNPPFAIVAGARDIERVKKAVPFPCVVKPTFLSGSRGVIRANDDAELAAALERAERIMNEPEPGGSTCAGPAFERPGEGLNFHQRTNASSSKASFPAASTWWKGCSCKGRFANSRFSTNPTRSTVPTSRKRFT
ncbi:MAG: hypothetical protein M5R36_02545 [Deltaproteobacteria bacterium]|nr:hypothetical protein [Deltaproteobacteria bacterium]